MMNAEQINASQKASVDQWFDLADKALDETEKLMDLNLNACRGAMEEMAHCCQKACEVRDMPGALQWQTGAFKPFAERSAEYNARLMGLASGSGLDFSRNFEAQWQSLGRQMNAWMQQTPVQMPSGNGPSLDYLRNAMQAFDNVWDVMRHNMVQSQQRVLHKPPAHKSAAKTGGRKGNH